MKILGLDSSGIVASVAVVEDDILVAEYTVNYKKTHSQTLLPMLDEIAKMTELDLNTMRCTMQHSAGNVPTGWSVSMRPGFFCACNFAVLT